MTDFICFKFEWRKWVGSIDRRSQCQSQGLQKRLSHELHQTDSESNKGTRKSTSVEELNEISSELNANNLKIKQG